MVIKYMNDRVNLFSQCKEYKIDAISLHNKISELLESKDSIPENVTYNSIKDSLGLNGIVGNYELKETVNNSWDKTIEIKEVNGQLFLSNGWRVILGRGLDYFQSLAGNYFKIGVNERDLRPCLETNIDFIKLD